MLLPVLKKAASIVGSLSALADGLGLHRVSIYQWKRVPEQYLLSIEKLQRQAIRCRTAEIVTKEEMRPDLYRKKAR